MDSAPSPALDPERSRTAPHHTEDRPNMGVVAAATHGVTHA